jgi:hypothetical protein
MLLPFKYKKEEGKAKVVKESKKLPGPNLPTLVTTVA